MNTFVSGILRLVILEGSCALLVLQRGMGSTGRRARRLKVAFAAVAAISLFSFANFGSLRGEEGIVNHWEQEHFYFGSKYLREVGYFDLYKAILLADAETLRVATRSSEMRDLRSFATVSVDAGLADRDRVRDRFSDARWKEFRADWVEMGGRYWRDRWLLDHGNTGSPAWALFAAPIAGLCGASAAGQDAMACVDLLLMVVLFCFMLRTFGGVATSVAITIWGIAPFCFDYVEGSLLRWDWLFAAGMSICLYKREKPFVAGAFLGYAIASKFFPIMFGLAWLIRIAWGVTRTREIPRRAVRFVLGSAAALAFSVAVSTAAFGGPSIWSQYLQRVELTRQEKFYNNQYSFRTVFLQIAESGPREFLKEWTFPREIRQAQKDVDIDDYRTTFLVARVVLTLLIGLALTSTGEVEALAMGPLLAYVWLMLNAYYWNMLAFVGLGWSTLPVSRPPDKTIWSLLGLHVVLAAFYFYLHFNPAGREGYFMACLLSILIVVWSVTTGIGWRRGT